MSLARVLAISLALATAGYLGCDGKVAEDAAMPAGDGGLDVDGVPTDQVEVGTPR